jgi:hypothetical protein
MKLTQTPGAIKRFRRTPWRFQQTVATPLEDLDRFVAAIAAAHGRIEEATVTIDQIVFTPNSLIALTSKLSPLPLSRESSITAETPQEAELLLKAALKDWTDFIFVPTPKPFVIYADHDEYITFYANNKSQLNQIIKPLESHGYELVQNWQREF